MPDENAAKRWDCTVLPDVIDAADEDAARVEFIQALVEDPSLIRVHPHLDADLYISTHDDFDV